MATVFLREVPRAKILLKRLENKDGKGKALSMLACKLGRTVYFIPGKSVEGKTNTRDAIFERGSGVSSVR
jgi:hypothetical protein